MHVERNSMPGLKGNKQGKYCQQAAKRHASPTLMLAYLRSATRTPAMSQRVGIWAPSRSA
jgi:hypothetical protein